MELIELVVLVRLVFAHIIMDFLFQTKTIVTKKQQKSLVYHLLHSIGHGVAAYIAVFNLSCWYVIPIVSLTHLAIDYWKITKKERLCFFIIDQVFHLFVLFVIWIVATKQVDAFVQFLAYYVSDKDVWIVALSYMLVLKPTSLFLYLFTKRWKRTKDKYASLQDAGKWIGYLERILILTFILVGKIEGVGFLLAAKSIFRFGDLNKSQDIQKTEYILIGTLASFVISISLGLFMVHLIG